MNANTGIRDRTLFRTFFLKKRVTFILLTTQCAQKKTEKYEKTEFQHFPKSGLKDKRIKGDTSVRL